MAKTQYLQYEIHLTNKATVATQQAAFPAGILLGPDAAAAAYSAPVQEYTAPFVAPCTRSSWFWSGFTQNRPRNVPSFTRSSGGWFGLSFLFGTTTTFYWVGKFVYAAPTAPEIEGVPTETVNLTQTSWAHGFEFPTTGEDIDPVALVSRDASRHVDGFGLACRGQSNSTSVRIAVTDWGAAARRATWERFYVRLRKTGAAGVVFWQTYANGSTLCGMVMSMNGAGQLVVRSRDAAGIMYDVATTSALTVNSWYKVDLKFSYATAGLGVGASFKLYLNGVLELDVTSFTAAVGLGLNNTHESSELGIAAAATYDVEFDLDDWTGKPWPATGSGTAPISLDWLNGTRIVALKPKAFGTANNYPGDFRTLGQGPGNVVLGGHFDSNVSSSVSAATCSVLLDIETLNLIPGSLGLNSMMAILVSWIGNSAHDGGLGYRINGGTLNLTTPIVESTTVAHNRVFYRPALGPTPTPITEIELVYQKAAQVTSSNLQSLCGSCELVGTFGQEDVTAEAVGTPSTVPARNGIHNAPYPTSPWARLTTRPLSPYIIHSGTYTGNGTGQDLVFRCPVNWLFIRKVAAAGDSAFRFSSMFNSAINLSLGVKTDAIYDLTIDRTFVGSGGLDDQEQRTLVRLGAGHAGTEACNQSGQTYQYVAVMDPGQRFMLNGAYSHDDALLSVVNALHNAQFLPVAGFFAWETLNGSTAAGIYYKGPGHGAAGMARLDTGTEIAAAITYGTGTLTTEAAAHNNASTGQNVAYNLWRREDGSTHVGRPKVVQIGSYVGNGVASRTISFTTVSGVRPLFAIVSPGNAVALYRDPSHLTTASGDLSNGNLNASTGITSGDIDSFTVGSALNANGVVYNWFVLPGSSTAGNGGWSIDGEFAPVEPDSAFDGPLPIGDDAGDPDETPVDPTLPVEPPDDTDDCAAGTTCVTQTTALINRALLEVGVTQFLTNYCTQQTKEAQIARLLYEISVRAVLHDFPWPFASKYATLALSGTQPTHADWTYSYLAPSDCIFPRRLVVSRGTADNPEPPPFMLSSQLSGQLIFTNEANAVLEYTMRPSCVAFTSDDLFREALKWHLAAALAPPLTRMNAEAERCMANYKLAIEKANAIIKPGVPGLRAAAATVDVAAACVTANIQVVNRALIRIGAQTIANLTTEQSREAVAAKLVFEDELRAILRDYSWKFAKRYNEALTLVAGTETTPANPDWQYSYRLPTDCIKVRRIVTEGTGRSFDRIPITFEVGTDATGGLLFTGAIDPDIEYTARVECAVNLGDDLFNDALAWRLAAALAPSLAQVEPLEPEQRGRGPEAPPNPQQRISHRPNQAALRQQVAQRAWGMYLRALEQARVGDANEAQPEKDGDAEWIEGRN